MKEKQIVMLNPSELKPYEKNPRKNRRAINKVAESIKEFGFKQPIVVDVNRVVIVGHTRLEAAKRLKLTEVPVIIADDLTEAQAKAYRLADNKTNEFSVWDSDLLGKELGDITDIDMSKFGFDFKKDYTHVSEVDVPDAPDKPITKQGILYKLGRHRLICGDSTSLDVVSKLLGEQRADLYLTDPPYGVDLKQSESDSRKYLGKPDISKARVCSDIANDKLVGEDLQLFLTNAFKAAFSILKTGASFYCWYADARDIEFRTALRDAGFKVSQCLLWVKNNFTLSFNDYHQKYEPCLYGDTYNYSPDADKCAYGYNGKRTERAWYSDRKQSNVLEFDKPKHNKLHPTMKPVELFDYLMQNSSKEGDIVFDSFGGSGTTIIAAEQNGRCGYCSELSEIYCDVIVQRYIDLVGSSKDIFVIDGDKEIPYEDYKKAMLELNKMEGDD